MILLFVELFNDTTFRSEKLEARDGATAEILKRFEAFSCR